MKLELSNPDNLKSFIEFINALNHLVEPLADMNKRFEQRIEPLVKLQKDLDDFIITFNAPIQKLFDNLYNPK